MTQLDNLKKQIQELEETCDAARDRIKNGEHPKVCVNLQTDVR